MSKKILIVDDSRTIRQQVKFVLNKGGYEVIEAEDGALGLAAVKEHGESLSMIVSDVNMPNMNGLEFVEAIRNQTDFNIPTIMLTTEGNGELISRAKAAGAKGWLVKPFKPEQLMQVAQTLVK